MGVPHSGQNAWTIRLPLSADLKKVFGSPFFNRMSPARPAHWCGMRYRIGFGNPCSAYPDFIGLDLCLEADLPAIAAAAYFHFILRRDPSLLMAQLDLA
jgi:hypothetical protein